MFETTRACAQQIHMSLPGVSPERLEQAKEAACTAYGDDPMAAAPHVTEYVSTPPPAQTDFTRAISFVGRTLEDFLSTILNGTKI